MEIKGYSRRKLSLKEAAAVSGFAQLAARGTQPEKAILLQQGGENLTLAAIENKANRLSITHTEVLSGIGTSAAVSKAAQKIMADFKKAEGIDLTGNAQAAERVENAVAEAFEKLTDSYTAEIFLPFIADVSHLEAHLSRMDADTLMADAFASVKEKLTQLTETAGTAVILSASEADGKRLIRILKEIPNLDASLIVLDDGSGQEKENAWIGSVIDREEEAAYPGFADGINPSVEAIITGRFCEICASLKNAPNKETDSVAPLAHGMEMAAEKLEAVLNQYHADSDRWSEAQTLIRIEDIPLGDMKALMKDILGVMDDLERGLKSVKEAAAAENGALTESWNYYNEVHECFEKQLGSLEIFAIEAEGQAFNPHLHDAAMHVEDEKLGENTVAQELRKGYMFGNAVLRYAVVKVAN